MNLERKVELERNLQQLINCGKTREDAVAILIGDDMEVANYLIDACLMPIDEITSEIEKYDFSSPKLDAVKLVDELCNKYNVDRKVVVERIKDVRKINRKNELETPTRLEILKERRDLLQKEKDDLSKSHEMNLDEKSVYYFGLGVSAVVSGLLFYSSNPIIAGLIPVTFAISIPTVRSGLIVKREVELVNELVNLGKEIDRLDQKLNGIKTDDFESTNEESIVNNDGPKLVKRIK